MSFSECFPCPAVEYDELKVWLVRDQISKPCKLFFFFLLPLTRSLSGGVVTKDETCGLEMNKHILFANIEAPIERRLLHLRHK